MEIETQPQLTIHGVDVFRVAFTSMKALPPPNISINLQVTPKVFYPKERPNEFTIILDAVITLPEYYELSVGILGQFSVSGIQTEDIRKRFINSNAPAILFPYFRSFISTFTSNLGRTTNPVIIPPQFLKGDLEEVKMPEETPAK